VSEARPIASGPAAPAASHRAERFVYTGFEVEPRAGELRCRYRLEGPELRQEFTELLVIEGVDAGAWAGTAVEEAARWVYLLLGASYYKAGAPPVIDVGDVALSGPDLSFLEEYYVDGLAEFAYRNSLDLSGLEIIQSAETPAARWAPPLGTPRASRPLVPFGGGIDSIVTTELVRRRVGDDETALFIVSKSGDRFAAIESAASETGLPVLRAERRLDTAILRSRELGYLNGHVPVTGMISAIAVLAALLHGRDAVVMSNESSASVGNVEVDGRLVNHQWSKGSAFESGFRAALARAGVPVEYFSLLRSASELWVAKQFAGLTRYHDVFHSCNRAFYVEASRRFERWCGECDKCCFVDLVLAPFVARDRLEAVFGGREPVENPELADRFRTLLGIAAAAKPFDCVGDIAECRSALRLAAARPDRGESSLLHQLLAELPDEPSTVDELLRPSGEDFVPDDFATADLLV